MALQHIFKLCISINFIQKDEFEDYLECVQGALSKLFLICCSGNHGLFEGLQRQAQGECTGYRCMCITSEDKLTTHYYDITVLY